jgi:hypothetical protein
MVIVHLRRFAADQCGASLVQTLIVLNILVLIVAAFVEFGVAMNQWNLAAKATQVGVRLASVSNPVDSSLSAWTGLGPDSSTAPFPGDPVAESFNILCRGTTISSGTCALESGTYSGGTPTYNAAAMGRLIYGSDFNPSDPADQNCDASGTRIGMCDVLPKIRPDNVEVRYQFTGLGYAARPGGPIPTITVSLTSLTFDFLLLGSLLGLDDQLDLPAFATTIVGEDLSTTFP